MTTLYLHIGHYKTGTTAIQAWLDANSALLAERGLRYLSTGRGDTARTSHPQLALPLAAQHGFVPPRWFRDTITPDAAFATLAEEIAQKRPPRALVSSEEFVQLALVADPAAALEDLRRRLPTRRNRFVFFLREPLSLFTAWNAEINKGTRARGTLLTQFLALDPAFLAQAPILDRYAQVFGRMSLRPCLHAGPSRAQLRRFLWATRSRVPPGAALPIKNKTKGLDTLEAQRYAKMTDEDRDLLSISAVEHFDQIVDRCAEIEAGYARLRRCPAPFALTPDALTELYRDLVHPAADAVALHPGEADLLARLAGEARARHSQAADALEDAARAIDASQALRKPPA